MARVVILMGVSGSGKTTVGLELARRLGWDFADADDFHPSANVAKMSQGVPLDEHDREPWLSALRAPIDAQLAAGKSTVLACSALRARYREVLGQESVHFVYLKGDTRKILERLEARTGHYMKMGLLESQLATLEEPDDVLVVGIDQSVATIVNHIVEHFASESRESA